MVEPSFRHVLPCSTTPLKWYMRAILAPPTQLYAESIASRHAKNVLKRAQHCGEMMTKWMQVHPSIYKHRGDAVMCMRTYPSSAGGLLCRSHRLDPGPLKPSIAAMPRWPNSQLILPARNAWCV